MDLQKHLKVCKKNVFNCENCEVKGLNYIELQEHLKTECEGLKVPCFFCDQDVARNEYEIHNCELQFKQVKSKFENYQALVDQNEPNI